MKTSLPTVSRTSKRRWFQFSLWKLMAALACLAVLFAAIGAARRHREFCLGKEQEHLETAQLFKDAKYSLRAYGTERDSSLRPARLREYDKVAASETELASAYRKAVWQPWIRLNIVEPRQPDFKEIEHKLTQEMLKRAMEMPASSAPAPNPKP